MKKQSHSINFFVSFCFLLMLNYSVSAQESKDISYSKILTFNALATNSSNVNVNDTSLNQNYLLFTLTKQQLYPQISLVRNSLKEEASLEIFTVNKREIGEQVADFKLTNYENTLNIGDLKTNAEYAIKISSDYKNAGTYQIKLIANIRQQGCLTYNNAFNDMKHPHELNNMRPRRTLCIDDCTTNCKSNPALLSSHFSTFNYPAKWYKIRNIDNLAFLNFYLTTKEENAIVFVFGERNTSDKLTRIHKSSSKGEEISAEYINVFGYKNIYVAVSCSSAKSMDYSLCLLTYESNGSCIDFFGDGDSLFVTRTSMGSSLEGPFKPGEEVTFHYQIMDWAPIGADWIHGLTPSFNQVWEANSLDKALAEEVQNNWNNSPQDEMKHWVWNEKDSVVFKSFPVGHLKNKSWYWNGTERGPDGPSPKFKWGYEFKNVRGSFENPLFQMEFTLKLKDSLDCNVYPESYVRITPTADCISGNYKIKGCIDNGYAEFRTKIECCEEQSWLSNEKNTICPNELTNITLSTDVSIDDWEWYSPELNISKQSYISPIQMALSNDGKTPKVYEFIFTKKEGRESCSNVLRTFVNVNPQPEADAGKDILICQNEIIQLGGNYQNAIEGFQFYWTPVLTNNPNPEALAVHDINYQLRVVNKYNCENRDEINIKVSSAIEVELPKEMSLCEPEIVRKINPQFSGGTGKISHYWTFEGKKIKNPLIIDKPGVYHLIASDQVGCSLEYDLITYADQMIDTLEIALCEKLYRQYNNLIQHQGNISPDNIEERQGSSPSSQGNVFCDKSTYYDVSLSLFEECNINSLPSAFLEHFIALGLAQEEGFLLFPNPAKGNIHIGIESNEQKDISMAITNQNGFIQKHFSFNSTIGYTVFTLPLEGLQAGIYSLKVTQNGISSSKIFTIQ